MAKALAKDLAESWGRGTVEAQTAVDVVAPETEIAAAPPEADSEDSQNEPETGEPPVAKQAKVDRVARYVM